MKSILFLVIASLVAFWIWIGIYAVTKADPSDDTGGPDTIFAFKLWRFVSAVTFIVVGIAFGVTSWLNNVLLKKYFIDFYTENKCKMWTASLGLSIPIFCRGLSNLLR